MCMSQHFAQGKIVLFSIINGAEVVGRVREATDAGVELEYPMVIRPIQTGPESFKLELYPHSLANPEGKHQFQYDAMLSVSTDSIPSALEKAYLERATSIILASAM